MVHNIEHEHILGNALRWSAASGVVANTIASRPFQ
jgi:hypothetical protein